MSSSSSSSPPFQSPALIMIDFQNDFCSPGGYADHCGRAAAAAAAAATAAAIAAASAEEKEGEATATAALDPTAANTESSQHLSWVREIIPNAKRLLEIARKAQIPIVHTREGYAPDLSDVHPIKLEGSINGGCEIGRAGPMGRFLIRGEQGHDIIPELYPLKKEKEEKEIVIDKPGFCAFRKTNLEELLLKQLQVKELIFAGVTADVCVHTTLRTATELGIRCYYVKDAISTFQPHIRKACEDMVEMEGGIWGHLVTVDTIQEKLQQYCSQDKKNENERM